MPQTVRKLPIFRVHFAPSYNVHHKHLIFIFFKIHFRVKQEEKKKCVLGDSQCNVHSESLG